MPQLLPRLEPASALSKPRAGASASKKHLKSGESVVQACQSCRRSKIKCDGTRPNCTPCASKGKACQYEGVVGQSRKAAVRSRLEALEKLFDALTSRSPEEAEFVLQEVRKKNDLAVVFNIDKLPVTPEKSTSPLLARSPPGTTMSSSSDSASLLSALSGDEQSSCTAGSRSLSASVFGSGDESSSGRDNMLSSSVSDASSSPGPNPGRGLGLGMGMRLPVFPTLPENFVRASIPRPDVFARATNNFHTMSGELFHIFSAAQTKEKLETAFYREATEAEKREALCCVSIVAAIGVQYDPSSFEHGVDLVLYDIARHFFGQFLENDGLSTIKVCVLLAMFNIMGKTSSALAYLAFGLAMSQRHGYNSRYEGSSSLSPEEVKDFRRTWRLMMFFSSWLSATLGSPRCGEAPYQSWCKLEDIYIETSDDLADIVQNEMTKVTMLAADMIRTHLSKKNLTPAGIRGITSDLESWHKQLHPRMKLDSFMDDAPFLVKMSMYQVHLLYMGALMLVYRRISSQFAVNMKPGETYHTSQNTFDPIVVSTAGQGLVAARHCSRIIMLMRGDDGVFKRCWLVIFHAYTSCVILLHAVAQMQSHQFHPMTWNEDLQHAQTCLDTLDFCGEVDDVAAQLHSIMYPIFTELSEQASRPPPSPAGTPTGETPDPASFFLIPDPETAPPPANLASMLYEMLSRPFREAEPAEFGDVSSVGSMWRYGN